MWRRRHDALVGYGPPEYWLVAARRYKRRLRRDRALGALFVAAVLIWRRRLWR